MTDPTVPNNSEAATRKRSRRWLIEAGVVGVAYAGITTFQTSDLLPNGTLAPNFTTLDLDGKELSLRGYSGKPLALHFWASWCGVCRQEFGMLNMFEQRQSNLLTLIAEEPSPEIVAFVRKHDLRYPIAYAPPAIVDVYRISAYPTTYYLTQEQTVSSATVGMSTGLAMRTRLLIAS